jgi:voltage-gated potassium channel
MAYKRNLGGWQRIKYILYVVIFRSNTPAGKAFDVLLLAAIIISVLALVVETIPGFGEEYYTFFFHLEWIITILFTMEFVLRIVAVRRPKLYVFSFYGIIDFLAILPAYLSLIFTGVQYLTVIRAIRLLRIFRIFKLSRYLGESQVLFTALYNSRYKVFIFFSSVMTIVLVMGSVMYFVEGPENGFTSIPTSIYWCIVTITTVGYGDITPLTPAGKIISSFLMITGYSIIAIPTGIVTAELTNPALKSILNRTKCKKCNNDVNDIDARFCKKCGSRL